MKHRPEPSDGGDRGDAVRKTRWQRREHLRTLEAIVYDGWDVPTEAFTALPADLMEIARDPMQSTRDRIRAAEALSHLVTSRIDSAVQLDRIMRLDEGTATDRVELLSSLTDAQMSAISLAVAAPVSAPRKRKAT